MSDLVRMAWEEHLTVLTELLDQTGMESRTKWGKPTYVHAGRNVAMAAAFKHHCGVWFFDGALLTDPLQVLENAQEGKTQAMRHWKFTDPDGAQDIPREDVLAYLREAMANAEEGKRVASPPRPQGSPDWCPALAAAFESEPEFQAAMLALTPGRQREYNDHVGSAKREATQLARLDKIRPLVKAGKGLHDKYRK